MKKTKLKKIVGSIAVCGLCIATAVFSVLSVSGTTASVNGRKTYADGFVTVDTETDGDAIDVGITELTENFFNPSVSYDSAGGKEYIPGSSDSGTITFSNNSEDTPVMIHFWAESTPEKKENGDKPYEMFAAKHKSADHAGETPAYDYTAKQYKAASDKLVSDYMDLEIIDPSGNTVYSGKANGPADDDMIYVGRISPGKTATYRFKLRVSTDLESFPRDGSYEKTNNLTHGYENTVAMIDWHFMISIVAAPTQTTQTTTTTTTTTKYNPPPGTGEAPNMYLFAAIACGVSALVIFYVTFGSTGKRRKKEEE